jgi:predicted phage terminase large subunit-like protein
LAQELKKTLTRPVRSVPVYRDKIAWLYVHQAKFEAGLVLFPVGTPFLPELETELLSFPQAKHDDQVDSFMHGQAYQTSISEELGANGRIKIVCVRSETVDVSVSRLRTKQ